MARQGWTRQKSPSKKLFFRKKGRAPHWLLKNSFRVLFTGLRRISWLMQVGSHWKIPWCTIPSTKPWMGKNLRASFRRLFSKSQRNWIAKVRIWVTAPGFSVLFVLHVIRKTEEAAIRKDFHPPI